MGFGTTTTGSAPIRGIGDLTPAERYQGQELPPPPARPHQAQLREPGYPPHAILRKVTSSGNTSYNHKLIQVGKRWAGATVRIVAVGELVHIYHGDVLARVLALDPDSYYQPLRPRKEVAASRAVS